MALISSMAQWPPDDTEAREAASDVHQTAILNLRLGINEIAAASAAPDAPPPWHAFNQTAIRGMVRANGTSYITMPDVFVYRSPIDSRRGSVFVALDGPPALVIEILDEFTYHVDLDLSSGKGHTYAHAGVEEYLVVDPTGLYLAEGIRAWHLEEGVYAPWLPNVQLRWTSRTLPLAFGVEGLQPVVFTEGGVRQWREGELHRALTEREAEVTKLRRQLAPPWAAEEGEDPI